MTKASASTAEPGDAAYPDYPMARSAKCPFDPPPGLKELQANGPIHKVRWFDGTTPWVVTGYDELRALSVDPRTTCDSLHSNVPHRSAGYAEVQKDGTGTNFHHMDDPEHARQRRMVTARFSVKRAETLRPAIQKMVDGLIDDILAGPKPVDLVQAFALPLPSLVTCEMLGVPYDDHVFLQDSTGQTMQLYAAPEEVAEGDKRLLGYVHRVLADKLASPGDDLFSEIADHVKRDELSRDQAARMMVMLILGGLDTTTNMIALSTMALLEHPDQLAILQDADDEKVVACAVEELLRYLSVAHVGQPRAALEDIQIGDQVISANDGMLLAVEGANWDPEVFPSPERLDLRRNTQGHVAFGFGTHQCLGQNLARVELQVACSTLFKRIPTLRLAVSPDHVAFKDSLVYGLAELPVTWESD